jgi:hypothetical protein
MSSGAKDFKTEAGELLIEIGLPPAVLEELQKDTDWSFVIKLHAMVEGALTHALADHLGNVDAREIFARLDTSNDKTGKVAFGRLLLELDSKDQRLIQSLSELRNSLVHDPRNLNFDFQKHFAAMDQKGKRQFIRNLGYWDDESTSTLDEIVAKRGGALRAVALESCIFLLAFLNVHMGKTRAFRELDQSRDTFFQYWHGSPFGKQNRLSALLDIASSGIPGKK